MDSREEKRIFSRSNVNNRVEIITDDGVLSGQLGDVGMSGLSIRTDATLPAGAEYPVAILLEMADSAELRLNMQGRIARVDGEGMAVEFTEIEADSFDHLRKLVLYNTEETEKVENEFEANPGIKRGGGTA